MAATAYVVWNRQARTTEGGVFNASADAQKHADRLSAVDFRPSHVQSRDRLRQYIDNAHADRRAAGQARQIVGREQRAKSTLEQLRVRYEAMDAEQRAAFVEKNGDRLSLLEGAADLIDELDAATWDETEIETVAAADGPWLEMPAADAEMSDEDVYLADDSVDVDLVDRDDG